MGLGPFAVATCPNWQQDRAMQIDSAGVDYALHSLVSQVVAYLVGSRAETQRLVESKYAIIKVEGLP